MACGVLVCIAFRGIPLPPLSEQTKEAKPSFYIDTRGNTCPCDTIEREVMPLYTDETGCVGVRFTHTLLCRFHLISLSIFHLYDTNSPSLPRVLVALLDDP